jgi:glycosyltransferase involved in cell wall biosynthesis
MKVVMLLGRSTGGIGTHVAQLSADLRTQGAEVLVVTHPFTAGHFELGTALLCWPGSAGPVRALRDFRRLRRLSRTADIVHAHGHQAGLLGTMLTLSLGRRSARRRDPGRRVPALVVSQHNMVLPDSGGQLLKRLSQRWVARRADLSTGASSDLVAQARAFGAGRAELAEVPSPRVPELLAQAPADRADRDRIRQRLLTSLLPEQPDTPGGADIPGGADASGGADIGGVSGQPLRGRPGLPDASAPLVVTISRIAPQKNLPVLVQAASLLPRSCTWVVLGDGDPQLMDQLRRQVGGLAAPVHFVGRRGEVDQWLRAAEVFVLPSEWEARALVVQEAMAAGTPVVATDVGGLHDLVLGTGLLIPPGDPGSIATAIEQVLSDPALRARLVDQGREAASALPDGSDTAAQWLGWYSQTLLMT